MTHKMRVSVINTTVGSWFKKFSYGDKKQKIKVAFYHVEGKPARKIVITPRK